MRRFLLTTLLLGTCGLLPGYLLHSGFLRFNYPSEERFPVQGIDASHHQGKIDWPAVSEAGVQFAFIKATEGVDFRDPRFHENWRESAEARVAHGAYHFFTFCRPGLEQARNFIGTIHPEQDMLPPVVDVEFGGNCRSPPGIPAIRLELTRFLAELETTYAAKPILYVTTDAYARIVDDHFDGFPLWVRDIFRAPKLPPGVEWTIWQYANRGRLPGVVGPVDLNVFHGDQQDFRNLLRAK